MPYFFWSYIDNSFCSDHTSIKVDYLDEKQLILF